MIRFLSTLLFVITVSLGSLVSSTAYAQTTNTNTNNAQTIPGLKEAEVDLSSWAGILDSITQGLAREGLRANELDDIYLEAERIRTLANAEIGKLQPRADELKSQLAVLGDVPVEGEPPEAEEVQLRRSGLNVQFAKVDADLKAAILARDKSQQVQRTITQERQSRFFSSISARDKSITTTKFWGKFLGGFKSYFRSLNLLFEDSFSIMFGEFEKKPWKIFSLIFFLALFALIFIRLRAFLAPRLSSDEISDVKQDFFSSRFARFCRQGILPVALIYAVYQLFWLLFLLTERFDRFLTGIIVAGSFYIVAIVLKRIILAPNSQSQRGANISDLAAQKISRIITIGLVISLAISIVNTTSIVLFSPVEVTMGLSFLYAVIIGIMSLSILWIYYKDGTKRAKLLDAQRKANLWFYLNILVWCVSFAILGAAIFGYVAMAEFLSQQLVFGLIVVGVAWLFLRSIDVLFAIPTAEQQAEIANLSGDETDASANQFAILGTGVLKLIVYLAAGILLMLPWGYRTSDFYQIFKDLFFGFEVGGLSISLSTILLASGLFFVGYTVTVALRSWLNNKLLPTTKLDIGISNSISTVFGYIGFILAAVLGVSAAGFDLSNLAIVAGALSVGVGFGLQSIVNNFVSGLILLAERPIKAGDWIVTSGGEGTVKKISVRSTEIETFDRATVIVPNSTLITDNVTNWTHENKTGRIIVAVGVGYDSDPDQVKEILLNCAKEHRLILGRPAPAVFFMDFGASSLDFQLRCFLADINYSLTVTSELRFAILAALREANIEIPFPQNDVHIRSDDTKRSK